MQPAPQARLDLVIDGRAQFAHLADELGHLHVLGVRLVGVESRAVVELRVDDDVPRVTRRADVETHLEMPHTSAAGII